MDAKPLNRAINRTALVVSDCHWPYHDEVAFSTCLNAIKVTCPTDVILIGDGVDGYPISKFPKSPERRADLKYEIECARKQLNRIQRAAGRARIVYIEGNHEHRLKKYLQEKAPELWGLVDMKTLLEIEDRGMEWCNYGDWITIGKVSYSHDVGRCGKNAVQQSLQEFGHSIVIGHTHRLGVAYSGTVRNDRHVAMSVGWLGDYDQVDYKHKALARREWQHGIGFVDYLRNGTGFCQAIPIIDGVCVIHGCKIGGNSGHKTREVRER